MRATAIRQLAEEHGPEGFLQIQASLLEGKELPNGRKERVRPEDFSIRALYEGLVGPVDEHLAYAQQGMGYHEVPVSESLTSSAFPSAVGMLVSAKVIEGYEGQGQGYIGDELVETVPSRLRGERMVGFTSLQGPKVVEEGEEYQDSTFGEKYVIPTETKRGRLLSVTEEAVFHDQTGQILARASGIGDVMRQDKERRIVRGVADVASTVRVYRPSGTGVTLYHADRTNLLSAATPLVDWTDIQEVLAYHAANMRDDREADDENTTQPLVWMPKIILTAVELAGNAARIVNAVEDRQTAANSVIVTGNMSQAIVPGIRALSSPFLDAAQGADQWDDASDWLIGDFKRQFKYKEVWPLQVFRAAPGNDGQFRRDIVAEFKVREYGDIYAADFRYVIKVNAV